MKSLYDSDVKSSSRYQGMYKGNYFNECWSIKFGFYSGIYGIVLREIKEDAGVFELYYFPSANDELLGSVSLFEAVLAGGPDFLEKVRNFSAHEELLNNFCVATIYIKPQERGLALSFKTKLRDRSYAKDGVCVEGKQIIAKEGLDKNFPSFRASLAFMNFLHIALCKIYEPRYDSFEIYKKAAHAVIYDKERNLKSKEDPLCGEIFVNLIYGAEGASDGRIKFDDRSFKKLSGSAALFKFLLRLAKEDKKQIFMQGGERPNFFIITGYLGSGKTKFIQNFIEHETAQNRFTGIIQNEIGKIGLDGALLDAKYALVEIDEGCVCCSMAGQIKLAISQLKPKKPDSIVLETTGVANPFNILSELNEIKDAVNLCAIVTVVDGANFLKERGRSKIMLEQTKAADVIVLNKIDLISPEQKERIRQALIQNNRCAEIFETVGAELNPNYLLYRQSDTSYMASVLLEGKMGATHEDEGIVSFKKDLPDGIDRQNFIKFMSDIPENFYRIKGLASFKGDEAQYVVQFVNGKFEITPFSDRKCCDNFLVFIGRGIKEDTLVFDEI
jgi:cobalamin synthesis protein, P47K